MITSLFALDVSVLIKSNWTKHFPMQLYGQAEGDFTLKPPPQKKRLRQRRCDSPKSENSVYVSFLRHKTNERDHVLLEAGIRLAALKGSMVSAT